MEREIKFRVFDAETKAHIGYERIGEHGHWEFKRDGRKEWLRGVITDGQVGKNHIRRQYTGLKDRNGKEIYEGDVLNLYKGIKISNTGHVKYIVDEAQYMIITNIKDYYVPILNSHVFCEIIGNVFEAPKKIN